MGIILPTLHEDEETGDLEFGDKVTTAPDHRARFTAEQVSFRIRM